MLDVNMIIANNIQAELKKENKKQVDLAEGIGVSKQTMSKIMNGARAINAIELHKISEYLHVSMDSLMKMPEKPMDIFHGWENYMQLLEQHWRAMVQPEDTVVLAGDLSWGMTLPQAKADFAFLETLPGQKIILKGNHDYWWNSMKKMQQFFADNGFDSLHILHNNHYAFQQYGICGTRGWVSINGETADAKVLAREVQRLEVSVCIERTAHAHCVPALSADLWKFL